MCDHTCAIVLCMGTPCPHGSARMRGILSTTCVNQVTPGNLSVILSVTPGSLSVTNEIGKRDFTYVRTYVLAEIWTRISCLALMRSAIMYIHVRRTNLGMNFVLTHYGSEHAHRGRTPASTWCWESQPCTCGKKLPAGNIYTPAAILYLPSKSITYLSDVEVCNNHEQDFLSASEQHPRSTNNTTYMGKASVSLFQRMKAQQRIFLEM